MAEFLLEAELIMFQRFMTRRSINVKNRWDLWICDTLCELGAILFAEVLRSTLEKSWADGKNHVLPDVELDLCWQVVEPSRHIPPLCLRL
jgi:hypothetical protein